MLSHSLLGLPARTIGRSSTGARHICPSCLIRNSAKPSVKLVQHSCGSAQFSTWLAIRRSPSPRSVTPYCSIQRSSHIPTIRLHSTTPTPRPIVSINAPSPIPTSTRGLHAALLDLERDAINYVPLSRIKLALRSLEKYSEDTVIRVAILGLGRAEGAKRLARCLLADVLSEKQKWESALEDKTDKRAVLLRYANLAKSLY